MKAIRLHETGGPEVLQLDDVPTPEPGPGQVLVKAHSIGTGIPDQLIRTGLYPWMPDLPTVPGLEMSGSVAALGAGVTGLHEGDPVFASAIQNRSCYAEYLAIDADWVFPCPDGIDMAAVTCLQNYRVAWCILHAAARLRAGDTVAIVGAAGGVGSALLQLANAADATTIGLARSPAKSAFVAELGADHVIETGSEDLTDRIMEITDGRGVDLFLDPVAGVGFADHLDLLAPVGMLVMYGLIGGYPPDTVFRAQRDRFGRSPAIRLFSVHAYDHQPEVSVEHFTKLMAMILDGRIKPAIFAELPLDMAIEAHKLIDEGVVTGKIILQPGRTEPWYSEPLGA
jgi:NADPH2:quinone reductase